MKLVLDEYTKPLMIVVSGNGKYKIEYYESICDNDELSQSFNCRYYPVKIKIEEENINSVKTLYFRTLKNEKIEDAVPDFSHLPNIEHFLQYPSNTKILIGRNKEIQSYYIENDVYKNGYIGQKIVGIYTVKYEGYMINPNSSIKLNSEYRYERISISNKNKATDIYVRQNRIMIHNNGGILSLPPLSTEQEIEKVLDWNKKYNLPMVMLADRVWTYDTYAIGLNNIDNDEPELE